MVTFTAILEQFASQGEKTGWTYIRIPANIAQEMKPGNKRSFRVKGLLDKFAIAGVALLPMGEGDFILAVNAAMRKGIGKKKGAMVNVQLTVDKKEPELNRAFMECLADEPTGLAFFNSIPKSFQHYFSKWIDSAKTDATRVHRIALAVSALSRHMNFPEMMREDKKNRQELGR